MRTNRLLPLLLGLALAANVVVMFDAVAPAGLIPRAEAREGAPDEADASAGDTPQTDPGPPAVRAEEIFEKLVEQVRARDKALDEREAALVDQERQLEVVRLQLEERATRIARERAALEARQKEIEGTGGASFASLVKAYGQMDPENAAGALEELYKQRQDVVIDLVLSLKPRQAGAILDALAARNAKIAASLSKQIWERTPRAGRTEKVSG